LGGFDLCSVGPSDFLFISFVFWAYVEAKHGGSAWQKKLLTSWQSGSKEKEEGA
jgi:hypothetical protein